MPKRLIRCLGRGGPVSLVWPLYICFGAIAFGVFSIPSTGAAIVLIPMFFTAGAVVAFGVYMHHVCESKECSRFIVVIGVALMLLASWTRALSVWGINQDGAGSNLIASVVWGWITIGCGLLLIAVWVRGLS